MRYDELLDLRLAEPFEPFRLVMASGRHYDVRHPELLVVGEFTSSLGIAHQTASGRVVADQMVRLTNIQVTEAVPLAVADQVDREMRQP